MVAKAGYKLLKEWLDHSPDFNQAELSWRCGVSRAAVSKWCSGWMMPSSENAKLIERLSGGAVPTTAWRRRQLKRATTRGGRRLQELAEKSGVPIYRLALGAGIKPRALARWATGEGAPRPESMAMLNETFGLRLTPEDFEARA